MPKTYTTHDQLYQFKTRFHNHASCDKPNWMQLEIEELAEPPFRYTVVIDHKDPEARKALGALIGRLWLVNETWKITTTRPN